jgi:hypothetical protein
MLSRRSFAGACAAAVAQTAVGATAPAPPGYLFSFQIVEQGGLDAGGNAYLDVGAMTARAGSVRARRILVQRRVMVRVDGPGASVRVSVALAQDIPGCAVRIDGMQLSSIPRVVDPAHRVNVAVAHTLDVDIPPDVQPGPFLANLQWVAEPF